mmetsp:Transcript_55775/g.172897  ORF Transcript_55775/g.172897 Transcript_55775/m.172897 type:complete len:217 (-) Transcript_55775:595-1245(-)
MNSKIALAPPSACQTRRSFLMLSAWCRGMMHNGLSKIKTSGSRIMAQKTSNIFASLASKVLHLRCGYNPKTWAARSATCRLMPVNISRLATEWCLTSNGMRGMRTTRLEIWRTTFPCSGCSTPAASFKNVTRALSDMCWERTRTRPPNRISGVTPGRVLRWRPSPFSVMLVPSNTIFRSTRLSKEISGLEHESKCENSLESSKEATRRSETAACIM